MNIHDATETAFRNGYEAGVKELAERVKQKIPKMCWVEEIDKLNIHRCVDNLAKELTKKGDVQE